MVWARLLHAPYPDSQVPGAWHWSAAVHTTGFAPTQAPAWQVSLCVHALASLQLVPLGLAGLLQAPVAGLQVPAGWSPAGGPRSAGVCPTRRPAPRGTVCANAPPTHASAPAGAARGLTRG